MSRFSFKHKRQSAGAGGYKGIFLRTWRTPTKNLSSKSASQVTVSQSCQSKVCSMPESSGWVLHGGTGRAPSWAAERSRSDPRGPNRPGHSPVASLCAHPPPAQDAPFEHTGLCHSRTKRLHFLSAGLIAAGPMLSKMEGCMRDG